jgi:phospholipid/cholesterol/gamma-HCH transport system substrate-binding protein
VETKELKQQLKLGAFVLGGIVLFLVTVFFIGSENNIFSRTFTVFTEFKNVEGLKEGDNVWLSGVKVGRVTDVTIASEGKVVVKLSLKRNQSSFIREDATASIGSDGLVGNKIVVIRPGTGAKSIEARDTIRTSSPADTQQLINIAKDVGENTRSLTADLSVVMKKINAGQGVVGELLNEGDLAKELRMAVNNLTVTGHNTAKASAELQLLLSDLRNGNGLMPTLINDSSYVRKFTMALNNIEKVSDNAATVSNSLQVLAKSLDDDNNAIGVLLKDPAVADRLKNTVENAEHASEKLDENMEALQHNFLLRRYFRKLDKKKEKEAVQDENTSAPATSKNN